MRQKAIYYILKDVKTKENKGDLFCSSISLFYLCNTENNKQNAPARTPEIFKNTTL